LIWDFLPLSHGASLSMTNSSIYDVLTSERVHLKQIRNITYVNGVLMKRNIQNICEARNFKKLSFRLDSSKHGCNYEKSILFIIKKIPALKKLEFVNVRNVQTMKAVLRLCQFQYLEVLGLYDACVNFSSSSLIDELSTVKAMHVDIRERPGSGMLRALFVGLGRIEGLRSVHISNTQIDQGIFETLAISVSACFSLRVTNCNLSCHHLYSLQHTLQLGNIRTFDISDNFVDSTGINLIFEAFAKTTTRELCVLSLENTFCYDEDDDELFSAPIFEQFCRHQPNLTYLNLSDNSLNNDFVDMNCTSLNHLKALSTLDLASNRIGNQGVIKLSRLENKLGRLDLHGNRINSFKTTRFMNRVFCQLNELNLGDNSITNVSFSAMCSSVTYGIAFSRLMNLELDHCSLGDHNSYHICMLMKTLPSLRWLNLETNNFTAYAFNYFCDELKRIEDKELAIIMLTNYIDARSVTIVPVPHTIIYE
jgi:hypothetical protein